MGFKKDSTDVGKQLSLNILSCWFHPLFLTLLTSFIRLPVHGLERLGSLLLCFFRHSLPDHLRHSWVELGSGSGYHRARLLYLQILLRLHLSCNSNDQSMIIKCRVSAEGGGGSHKHSGTISSVQGLGEFEVIILQHKHSSSFHSGCQS